jgi:hypothetical protein
MVAKCFSVTAAVCAAVLGLSAAAPSSACSFHIAKVEKTAADWLVSAEHLVLARPNPENPLQYKAITALRGGDGTGPLPFLVASGSRRLLAGNPEDSVLFAAGENGNWVLVAYADAAFRPVMRQILAESEHWGGGYSEDRFRMFEALQDHPNARIRTLALREIDKAPYAMLRGIDLRLAPDDILDDLWTLEGYAYQPVRILLLGISGSDEARDEVYSFLDRVQDWAWAENLGAYATALIELDGGDGLRRLEDMFLSSDDQPLDKMEQIVAALAEQHASGNPEHADQISGTLRRYAAARPAAIPAIARQFSARSDWSQTGLMELVLSQRGEFSSQDLLSVAVYLAQARAAGIVPAHVQKG